MSEHEQLSWLAGAIRRWDRWRRATELAVWVPRGLGLGLVLAAVVALAARLRPLLMPDQVRLAALALLIGSAIGSVILVFVRPRSRLQSARFFDRAFGLRERLSTAFEINGVGLNQITIHQLHDAVAQARLVEPRRRLPVRFRRRELVAVLLLGALAFLAVTLPNPQSAVLAQQNAITTAINAQKDQIRQLEQDVRKDPNLSDEEKAQLARILDDAAKRLDQAGITRQEAVAALADAQQKLTQAQTQLTQAQQKALADAGQALSGNPAASQAAQGLQNANLSQGAQGLQNLANQLGGMSAQQASDLAEALDRAADALQQTNPQAAQALRDAANALRNGDNATAQKALQHAADALRKQQQDLNSTGKSLAARKLAGDMSQGQQDVAQAGGNANDPGQNAQLAQGDTSGADQSGQGGQQAGQQTNGNAPPPSGPGNQPGQPGGPNQPSQPNQQGGQGQANQGQPAPGNQPNPQSGNGAPPPNAQPGSQPGQGSGQSGQNQGQGQQGQGQGSGQQSGAGQGQEQGQGQGNGQGSGQAGGPQGPQQGQGNGQGQGQGNGPDQAGPGSRSAGQGAGGSGSDVTSGAPQGGNGPMPTNNNATGTGGPSTSDRIYAPSFIGGSGGTKLNPTGAGGDPGSATNQTTTSDPTGGNAVVPLSDVINAASAQAASAMDADYVPLGLRGVIHDYFSGLQPTK